MDIRNCDEASILIIQKKALENAIEKLSSPNSQIYVVEDENDPDGTGLLLSGDIKSVVSARLKRSLEVVNCKIERL